jgi:hypothetical protein
VRRFSTRQDASSKNPDYAAVGSFELDLSVFFGDFLCAKESYPRVSAEALPLFNLGGCISKALCTFFEATSH